jgi:hypothetical protein
MQTSGSKSLKSASGLREAHVLRKGWMYIHGLMT